MGHIVLYEEAEVRANLLPLSYTRPVAHLRVGITTIAEKWQDLLPGNYSYDVAEEYLREKYPLSPEAISHPDTLFVASNVIPDKELVDTIKTLEPGQTLVDGNGRTVARRSSHAPAVLSMSGNVVAVDHLYDIFTLNHDAVWADFKRLTSGRKSAPLSTTNTVVGSPDLVFLEEGAQVECAVLNTKNGPVYVGRDAEIMEGSLLRGPVALCEHAVVNMGCKIYGATTLGPYCKAGGELNNVVMTGYSNKAHDGFLGNAVIGEWCNLGAGCVASNLKNNYTLIKLWNYPARRFMPTGLQFCGLIMGDHSRAGINTMFNTATVIGVGVNIYEAGFPRNFVASFSQGSSSAGFTDVPLAGFIDAARRMMARRNIELTPADERMFEAIKECADNYK